MTVQSTGNIHALEYSFVYLEPLQVYARVPTYTALFFLHEVAS